MPALIERFGVGGPDTIADVLSGRRSVHEVLQPGPAGIQVVPGAFSDTSFAEIWLFPGVYLDPTVPTNLAKFLNGSGNPVDLGTDGSTPTGSIPPLYLSQRTLTANDFAINHGNGGALVLTGTLTLAATVPKANTP